MPISRKFQFGTLPGEGRIGCTEHASAMARSWPRSLALRVERD